MKDMSIKYIVREAELSTNERLMLAYFNGHKLGEGAKLQAFGVYMRLLMKMANYRDCGFFIKIGKAELALFADDINVSTDFLIEVIDSCLSNGIFDQNYFDKYRILTSLDIQEKYFYSHTVVRRLKKNIHEYKPYIYQSVWDKIFQKKQEIYVVDNYKDV